MADTQEGGGLGALSLMFSGSSLPGQDQLDALASTPLIPPENRWLNFAAGALAPTKGGHFSENLSNAISGYTGTGEKEAELRAKYLPMIAQALLQRQQMAITLQANQTKLIEGWDDKLSSGLTGLLANRDPAQPITFPEVVNMAKGVSAQAGIPPQFAMQWLGGLPDSPAGLTTYAIRKSVAAQSADKRLGSVTPSVEPTDTGGDIQFTNRNPFAGPTPTSLLKTLSPPERLPKTVETPRGPAVFAPATGKSGMMGTPEGQAVVQEGLGAAAGAPGAPAPGQGTTPPTPGTPTLPGSGGAPSKSLETDPNVNAADKVSAEAFAKEQTALDARVHALADVASRVKEMRELMAKFRTGATADSRMWLASRAKDVALLLGASGDQAEVLAQKLMQGDLASAQALQKLALQGAMESLKSAMDTGAGTMAGRATQAEFAVFKDASVRAGMDPGAIEHINNFVMKSYEKALQEQKFLAERRAAGAPFQEIMGEWARKTASPGGFSPLESTPPRKPGAPATQVKPQGTGTSISGKRMKLVNGNWEYEE